jgi:hypothetical protein
MTIHTLIEVSNTSAQKITPPGIHSGMDITLQNVDPSGYIYVGAEGVSSSNYGYRILPNHSFSIELPGPNALYVIASAPNTQLAILKTSLENQK